MSKKILTAVITAFALTSASYASDTMIAKVTQSIERLEKHLDMITKRFGGKLGAEEKATKKQIATLHKMLEDARQGEKDKKSPSNTKISALEQRLMKLQKRFGIGGLKGEETALKAQIKALR